jgi:hypothetical protein
VQVGEARIALDAPPGFADTGFTGSPRLLELAEGLTSASNRIVLFAISDADLRRFTTGDQLELKRYMLVATPKGLERDGVTVSAFDSLVGDAMRALGRPPVGSEFLKYLDAQPVGQASLLAELRKSTTVASVLQGSRIPGARRNDPPQYVLTTTTLMLLRGKALNLSVHTLYESPADLDWIRATTIRWVEELQRLNGR